MSTYVDPSRNPLHDEASGLYHGDVPVDPSAGPILRPADDPEGFNADTSSDMAQVPETITTDVSGDDGESYDDMTKEQLIPIAKERGIPYSGRTKAELVEALEAADETDDDDDDPDTGPVIEPSDPDAETPPV